MVNWSKFSGISPEQARKELNEATKEMSKHRHTKVESIYGSKTYKKYFGKLIFAEQYLNGIKKNHPNSEIINIPPGERGEYTFMIKDSMEQLAMIGVTTDAGDLYKMAMTNKNPYLGKLVWIPIGRDKYKAVVMREDGSRIYVRTPQGNSGWFQKHEVELIKDDDATEHGSVETYGKEKETETMPLEKNPVQAQDAMIYKDQRGNIWQVVENTGADFYGLKCTAGPRKGEKIYVKGKDLQSMQRIEDEAPTDVKDTRADGDPETMTTQEAREYWNKYHNSDPILEDYPSFEAWYRESKMNGYIVDEAPNHVQDSYEMLKLCGIIS